MRNFRPLALGLYLGASAVLIVASSSVYTTYGTGNGTAQAFVQLCPNSDGTQNAVPCPTGGGGSGGTVTQGPAGSASWLTSDVLLDQLISAGALSVSVGNFPTTQPISATSLPLPTGAATSAIQANTQAPVAPGTATATKSDLIGCLGNTSLPAFTAGQQGAVACTLSGQLDVFVGNTSAQIIPIYLAANAGVGAFISRAINAASSAMPTSVKTSFATLYGYNVCNSNSTVVYFRLFNLATAPTVGTSTGIDDVKVIAATSCASFSSDIGSYFSAGIAYDVTSGSMADSDTTTIATANTVNVSVFYK